MGVCIQVAKILGSDRVLFVEDGIVSFSPMRDRGKNPIGNPGSLESALIDMALLSHCDDIVTTFASSFGYVAAAWGGIAPVCLLLSPCFILKSLTIRVRHLISPRWLEKV